MFLRLDKSNNNFVASKEARQLIPDASLTPAGVALFAESSSLNFEDFIAVFTNKRISGLSELKAGFDSLAQGSRTTVPINRFDIEVSTLEEQAAITSSQRSEVHRVVNVHQKGVVTFQEYCQACAISGCIIKKLPLSAIASNEPESPIVNTSSSSVNLVLTAHSSTSTVSKQSQPKVDAESIEFNTSTFESSADAKPLKQQVQSQEMRTVYIIEYDEVSTIEVISR
jgi:uncharacterized protein YbcV (DUF1398 family)